MAAIGGPQQNVGGEIEFAGIEWRKNDRERAVVAVLAGTDRLGSDVGVFVECLVGARDAATIKDVRVARVHGDVAVLLDARQAPFPEGNFPRVAAALRGGGAAFLLCAVNPVRKTIIGDHVIELRRWLVVPAAPGLPAIDADDRPLIAGEGHDAGNLGIDPHALVVVAARRALETDEGFAGVGGFPGGGVGNVNRVSVIGCDSDAHRAGPAATDAVVVVYTLPAFAGVVGTIDARLLLCFQRQVHALRVVRSNGDADAADDIVRGGQALGDLPPGVAAVGGFVQAAAGNDKRHAAANLPRRNTCRPEGREKGLRIGGVHHQVGCAGVFILIEDLLEG